MVVNLIYICLVIKNKTMETRGGDVVVIKESEDIQKSFNLDFELNYSEENLNDLSKELSEEDEKIFEEILKLEEQGNGNSNFMKDLLDAAKAGTMQYLDAMTDTGETFDRLKDPDAVRKNKDEEIIKKMHSANPDESREYRTMKEAGYDPFDKNVAATTSGMSEKGVAKFARHKEAYSQRTKSITGISNGNNTIHYKTDPKANSESLSGLRGYRVGPVVPMHSVDEIQEKYNSEKAQCGKIDNTSGWLRKENFSKFDEALMKEYGFKTAKEAAKWRAENHLTIHESPEGMFLVPTDVHDAAGHSGYVSKMSALLKGEITKENLNAYIVNEKVEYVKHEVRVRGTRAVKGVGMSAIKDVLKCSVVVICEETHTEFSHKSEDSFIDRMLRVLKNSWEHVKAKCAHILRNLWSNIKGSIFSEILTMINDFFIGTFKNIFRIVRQMFSSIKSAFKIIFSKDKSISFGERIFEAGKVLAAGVVGIIGFSLNELIEKGLTSIGVPFASFIAECLSGLFAGIMSAIVIMLFDKLKKYFKTPSVAVQALQLHSRSLCINSAQIQISSLKSDMQILETYNFMGQIFSSIKDTYQHIKDENIKSEDTLNQIKGELEGMKQGVLQLQELRLMNNDNEF